MSPGRRPVFTSRLGASMARRLLAVVGVFLGLAPAAQAAQLGLAEVRSADGRLVGRAGNGTYAYPADGSVLRVGSAHAFADRVVLRDVTMFNGRVSVDRLIVPARGLHGAQVDGLIVDGKAYQVAPNSLIPLPGGSYIVALQEAVTPGRNGSGLVALRAYVSDPSLGLAPGTQVLVGFARAARPTGIDDRAAAVLGLPQLRAAQASAAGVPVSFTGLPLPALRGNPIGLQAVAMAERFLGVPYVWAGASPGGFDCSGLTMYVYGLLGIHLTHFTGSQIYEGRPVASSQLQPGDLVFFYPDANGVPHHEGMYIGNGQFIHAPHTGDVVKISSLFETRYGLSYVGAVRPYVAATSSPFSTSTISASG
jgi:cell wall-associated NlpC family hydrolase